MCEATIVNAGFLYSGPESRRPKHKPKWVNVSRISVPLPYSEFGAKEFRDKVREAGPGPDYSLQGYVSVHVSPDPSSEGSE